MLDDLREEDQTWLEYKLGEAWPLGYDDIQDGERVCLINLEPPAGWQAVQGVVCADWMRTARASNETTDRRAVETCLALLRGAR